MNQRLFGITDRIGMQWLPAAQLEQSSWLGAPQALGIVQFGGPAPLSAPTGPPQVHLQTPVLHGSSPMAEVWSGRFEAHDVTIGAARCRHNGEVMFAAVSVQPAHNADDAFGAATYTAYRALFDALGESGYPHLLRIWNSIPDINVDDAGLERYRRFNLQRYRAYEESNQSQQSAPAACALGSHGGPFVLHCLASKDAAVAIENPRQVSAYRYPQQYGPRAPFFSRAALWRGEDACDVLFVSGTASIVGHETQHQGDVVAQTRETLANLSAVVAEAVRHGARGIAALSDLKLKVYVRDPQNTELIRGVLTEHGLDANAALYLHADVCRSELLMEIEAVGGVG